METDFQHAYLRAPGGTADNYPQAEVRIGLPGNNEFVVLAPNYNHQRPTGAPSSSGFSATTIAIKHEIGYTDKWLGAVEALREASKIRLEVAVTGGNLLGAKYITVYPQAEASSLDSKDHSCSNILQNRNPRGQSMHTSHAMSSYMECHESLVRTPSKRTGSDRQGYPQSE
jgi:hypothetical protein